MPISFFSPILPDSSRHPREKYAFLRISTNFFNFGQKAHTIMRYDNNSRIEVIARDRSKPSWIGTLIRVIALFTVIIPLIMALGIWIYRKRNDFQLGDTSNKLNQLPDDVLRIIFQKAGPYCLKMGATNKKNSEIVENTDSLKMHRIGLRALEQSFKLAKGLYDRTKIIQNDMALVESIGALALVDPERALEKVEAITWSWFKVETLAAIAKALAVSNPQRATEVFEQALALANTLNYSYSSSSRSLIAISEALTLSNPQKAVEVAEKAFLFANNLSGFEKFKALFAIAKVLSVSNPLKALEIVRQTLTTARFNLVGIHAIYLLEFLPIISSVFRTTCLSHSQKTEKVVDQIIANMNTTMSNSQKIYTLAYIALALNDSNLQKSEGLIGLAIEAANTEVSNFVKSTALASIALLLKDSNLQKSEELIDLAIEAANAEVDDKLKILSLLTISSFSVSKQKAVEVADQALEIANTLQDDIAKSRALAEIAFTLPICDSEKKVALSELALEKISSIEVNGLQEANVLINAQILIFMALSRCKPQKAMDIANQTIIKINSNPFNDDDKSQFLEKIARELAGIYPKKAVEVANTIPDAFKKSISLKAIALDCFKSLQDPNKAVVEGVISPLTCLHPSISALLMG